jgi:hypothetical protein
MQEDNEIIENRAEEAEKRDENFREEHRPIQPTPLGSGQKFAVFVLAVFAIAAIGMWMVQFKNSITEPFAYRGDSNSSNIGTEALLQEEDSEEALKSKDTDADGLSDWDELYFYKTSPYLEDSDSDGFSDNEEVDSENDPNCPTGRDCYGIEIIDDSNVNEPEQLDTSGQNQEQELQNILDGQGDAATLREMLLEAGIIDKKTLDQISDEDLIKYYQETLNN